jgi:hypothetical protein
VCRRATDIDLLTWFLRWLKNEFGFQFCAGQAARIGGVHDVYPVSFGFDVSGKFDLLVYGAEASFVFGDMFGKKTISTKNKGHTGLSKLKSE